MGTPDRLIRAARHYERAVHILIRQTVKSVQNHMVSSSDQVNNSTRPPIGILKKPIFSLSTLSVLLAHYQLLICKELGSKQSALLESTSLGDGTDLKKYYLNKVKLNLNIGKNIIVLGLILRRFAMKWVGVSSTSQFWLMER